MEQMKHYLWHVLSVEYLEWRSGLEIFGRPRCHTSHDDLVIILLGSWECLVKLFHQAKKLCSVIVNTPYFQDGENISADHCNNVCIGFGLLLTS